MATSRGYICPHCKEHPIPVLNEYLAQYLERDDLDPKHDIGGIVTRGQKAHMKCPCGGSVNVTIIQLP